MANLKSCHLSNCPQVWAGYKVQAPLSNLWGNLIPSQSFMRPEAWHEGCTSLGTLARLHPDRLPLPFAVSCLSSSKVARGHTQEADSLSFTFKDGRIRACFWSTVIPFMWHFESLRLGLVTVKMKDLPSQWLFILSLSRVCLIDKKAPKELRGILPGLWVRRTEWRAPLSAAIPPGDRGPCSPSSALFPHLLVVRFASCCSYKTEVHREGCSVHCHV